MGEPTKGGKMKFRVIIMNIALMASVIGNVYAAESLKEAFTEGTPYVNIRIRNERVNQEGLDEANSNTLRIRPGFKTSKFLDVVGVIEGEGVFYLGNDDYNDTVNGRTGIGTVADPENIQVNQAYGEYTGIPDTAIRGGRQEITLDGHRFIGNVGWRQNNQVFDAAMITNKSIPDTVVNAGYIYNVNRIFGEQSKGGDWESNSPFYNIANTTTAIGKIITYGYLLDFGSDSAANSNKTFGGSLSGKRALNDEFTIKYYGEYARQTEFGDNTTNYGADYYHIAPALVWKGLTTTVGYEVLGSDNSVASFRTPLATLHKWNGWADKFLTTPAAGLQDLYVDLTYKVSGLGENFSLLNGILAKFQYHDFTANDGGADYGKEWGLFAKKSINKHLIVSAKYSNYKADTISVDTQKLTFDVGIKF